MVWVRRGAMLLVGLAVIAVGPAKAQVRSLAVPAAEVETNLAGALGRLASRAGSVFVGTVESIERTPGVVQVSLRVEQVLQGQPGSRYLLREWAGRWPPGLQRYMVGQRALFFLNAPSISGLSSPVDSGDGVLPVFGDPADGATVDVTRLNATLLRQLGEKLSDTTTMSLQQVTQTLVREAPTGYRPANPSGEQALPIVMRSSVDTRFLGASDAKH